MLAERRIMGVDPRPALVGFLVSPGMSLFVYSPVLLLLPATLPRFWRAHRAETWTILALFASNLLFYASYQLWTGLFSCPGPRYLFTATVFLMLPLGPWLDRARERCGALDVRRRRRARSVRPGAQLDRLLGGPRDPRGLPEVEAGLRLPVRARNLAARGCRPTLRRTRLRRSVGREDRTRLAGPGPGAWGRARRDARVGCRHVLLVVRLRRALRTEGSDATVPPHQA